MFGGICYLELQVRQPFFFFTVKAEAGRSSDTLATPLPDNMASHPTRHQYLSLIDEGDIKEIYAKLQVVTHT